MNVYLHFTLRQVQAQKVCAMKSTIEWLDLVKARHQLSDYALAPKLGISRSQVSNYRNGRDFLSDDAALKVAELLELEDPQPVVASAHAERAKSEPARQFWSRLAAAAVAGLVVTVGGGSPAPSAAATVAGGPGMIVMSNDGNGGRRAFNSHRVTAGYHLPD